ncbi:hypothetical protein Tcan_01137, partial [Toxocara canis]
MRPEILYDNQDRRRRCISSLSVSAIAAKSHLVSFHYSTFKKSMFFIKISYTNVLMYFFHGDYKFARHKWFISCDLSFRFRYCSARPLKISVTVEMKSLIIIRLTQGVPRRVSLLHAVPSPRRITV